MKFGKAALAAGAMVIVPHLASAQDAQGTAGAAATELPAVDVVQETPVQKAARKKKAVPISPLATAPSTPPPAATGTAPADSASRGAGLGVGNPANIKVPSAVSTVTDADISRDGVKQIQQVLQQNVPGIIISDAAGNPLRAEISYRGFDASPVGGRSQGLAVYQNGVRINEAFGDTVNWDLIPTNAIDTMTVVSNNPAFGLNALGGAISIIMKDGFSYEGAEVDLMAGSFGRAQFGVQAGANSGNAGIYVAAEGIKDDGFRDFSDSEIGRFYGDIGLRGSAAELHVSLTAADSTVGVTAAGPLELLRKDWENTFTSPQDTSLELLMPTISGTLQATNTLSFSGVGYYRHFKSNVIDGNLSEADECTGIGGSGFDGTTLCIQEIDDVTNLIEEEQVIDQFGNPVASYENIGSIERINTKAESWGGSVEAVEKTPLFGRPNLFLVGASYDHGKVDYDTSSELGVVGPKFVVSGTGFIATEPEDLAPRMLSTENTYWGLYFSNALDVTDQLTVTVGGRYNHATIKMDDLTGEFDELDTTNKYERFNPMAGATYKIFPGLAIYGGYSEANRAPTAAELGCAEPENPCLIESFLTDDPPLKQVVSHTAEIGVRGESKSYDGRLTWSAGLFRTLNEDDILNVAAEETGRGFFLNGGDTLRQGVELAASYQTSRWQVYGTYAFVDATIENDLVIPARGTPEGSEECPDFVTPGNAPPDFEEPECNFVSAGDRLPGIPRHRFKAGFDYWITPKWKFGSDMVAASDQIFFGDEANNNKPLGGYVRFDFHSSYDITDKIQIYGLVKNAFNAKYGVYGTYFEAEEANEVEDGTGVTFSGNDNRSIGPSMPFAAYGGVKMKF
ncbi:MAG: TonB-dependent receptor [Hyphomicrobium sp.]|uniref:TonB-dependent receptor n=1 Tax=Hyphomicrobium sp. TaxID=82 RepID=UPI003D0AFEF0